MTAQTTTRQRQSDPLDLSQARLISRRWDEARQLTFIEAEYPARDRDGFYKLAGWSNGKIESCECDGWRFRQSCRHGNSFPLLVEEFEREHYRGYSTGDLLANVEHWETTTAPLTNDQRLAYGAQRAVLSARGVRAQPSAAVAAKGRAAVADLFEEGLLR